MPEPALPLVPGCYQGRLGRPKEQRYPQCPIFPCGIYSAAATSPADLSKPGTALWFDVQLKVLSRKFRGKYLHYLKQYFHQNLLKFYGNAQEYQNSKLFKDLINQCYARDWYTYTKKTFSGPLAVVQYLGRYTHRITISNTRIVSMDEHTVTITVRDYKCSSQTKTLTLEGVEFIRRFLMHILPKGFVKIRHYGLLANRNKKTKLRLIPLMIIKNS
jgi:hypothetical protein